MAEAYTFGRAFRFTVVEENGGEVKLRCELDGCLNPKAEYMTLTRAEIMMCVAAGYLVPVDGASSQVGLKFDE